MHRDILVRQIEVSLEREIFSICGKMRTSLAERSAEVIHSHQRLALDKAIAAVRILEMSAKDESAREAYRTVLVVLGAEAERAGQKRT